MSKIFVHTLGDSTIDNVYWLLNKDGSNVEQAKKDSVEGSLKTNLGKEYTVVSHAVDGFTTNSLLSGDTVGRVLSIDENTKYPKGLAYLQAKEVDTSSLDFHPLNSLKAAIQARPDDTHYVVLSVGGNDFRERLYSPLSMLGEIPRIHERYLKIVDEVKGLGGKNIRPIIMTQYRLDVNNDAYGIYRIMNIVGKAFGAIHAASSVATGLAAIATIAGKIHPIAGAILGLAGAGVLYLASRIIPLNTWQRVRNGEDLSMATLSGLMEGFYKPILERAKREKIPVLDLPNTFNPREDLYTSQIEPNKNGGKLIAEGLAHIIKTHNYEKDPSMLYAKKDALVSYTASINPGKSGWRVRAM